MRHCRNEQSCIHTVVYSILYRQTKYRILGNHHNIHGSASETMLWRFKHLHSLHNDLLDGFASMYRLLLTDMMPYKPTSRIALYTCKDSEIKHYLSMRKYIQTVEKQYITIYIHVRTCCIMIVMTM